MACAVAWRRARRAARMDAGHHRSRRDDRRARPADCVARTVACASCGWRSRSRSRSRWRFAPSLLLFVPPAALNVAFGVFFAVTLAPGREPRIASFARLERGELPPDLARYTRRLTWLWTVFFFASAAIGLLLAAFAPLQRLVGVRQRRELRRGGRVVRRRIPVSQAALPPLPACAARGDRAPHVRGIAGRAHWGGRNHECAAADRRLHPGCGVGRARRTRARRRQVHRGGASACRAAPEGECGLLLCADRLAFALGFAAMLLRRSTALLPPSHAAHAIDRIVRVRAPSFALVDRAGVAAGVPEIFVDPWAPAVPTDDVPSIADDHVAAVVYTSGTTGDPQPHAKTVVVARRGRGGRCASASAFARAMRSWAPCRPSTCGGSRRRSCCRCKPAAIVHAGVPLLPHDIAAALAQVPGRRWLVVDTAAHPQLRAVERAAAAAGRRADGDVGAGARRGRALRARDRRADDRDLRLDRDRRDRHAPSRARVGVHAASWSVASSRRRTASCCAARSSMRTSDCAIARSSRRTVASRSPAAMRIW